MDQRSDELQQDIVATRTALDDKLETLERKVDQMVDPRYQIGQHPWLALGGAIAAGYVLGRVTYEGGRLGARTDFDSKIALLKTTLLSALMVLLQESIGAYARNLGRQLARFMREQG